MTDASNVSQVKDKLEQLHKAFEEFTRAYAAYHNQLEDLYNIEESWVFQIIWTISGPACSAGKISSWIVSSSSTDSNNCLEANIPDGIDNIAKQKLRSSKTGRP